MKLLILLFTHYLLLKVDVTCNNIIAFDIVIPNEHCIVLCYSSNEFF